MHSCERDGCSPMTTPSAADPAKEEAYTKTAVILRIPLVWGREADFFKSQAVQDADAIPQHPCKLICPTCDAYFGKIRSSGLRPNWFTSNFAEPGLVKLFMISLGNVCLWGVSKIHDYGLDPAEFAGEGSALPEYLDGPVQTLRMPLLRNHYVSVKGFYKGEIPKGMTPGAPFELTLTFEER